MVSYLVHLPAETRPGSADGLDRMILVKDRFHWVALVFPLVWLLFNRLWLAFLVALAAGVAVAVAASLLGLSEGLVIALELLLALAVGVFAPELRSAGLRRRGLVFAGVVTGRTEDEAMRRFADRWLTTAGAAATPAGPSLGTAPPARAAFLAPPVLGLFPEAGRS